jgi:acetyl-CoA synthetase
MLPDAKDFDQLYRDFRWKLPARYNIGVDCCDKWADREPGRLAILHVQPDGREDRVTFGWLRETSNRLANVLRANGVTRGDRVAIMLPQAPEVAAAHVAIYKLGAVALPIAVLFGPDALAYRLQNSGAKALLANAQGIAKLAEIRAEAPGLTCVISIDGKDEDVSDFHAELSRASSSFTPVDTAAEDPAMMIYTSGTTGQPKGALHAHRVLLGHMPGAELPHYPFPQKGDSYWTPADWAWAGGLLDTLLPSLHHGVPVIARKFDKFDPEEAFALMQNTHLRNAFIPPTALRMMRAVPNPRGRYQFKLRSMASGGESLGIEALEWGRLAFGLTVNEFYGQTECNLVVGACDQLGQLRVGSMGKAVPGHTVAVIGLDGRVLKPGETGQIAVKRPDPVMFLEYWERPQATRDKFIGGWMTTGDQGVMDEDGYITFVGRDDDVISSSGFRIGPGEIEDCLISHPAVALAAAVGKPDPVRGEIVKACIVLKKNFASSPDLAAEIQTYVRTRLSAHEYPREVAFIDDMPMTTTGKVIRRLLREKA